MGSPPPPVLALLVVGTVARGRLRIALGHLAGGYGPCCGVQQPLATLMAQIWRWPRSDSPPWQVDMAPAAVSSSP